MIQTNRELLPSSNESPREINETMFDAILQTEVRAGHIQTSNDVAALYRRLAQLSDQELSERYWQARTTLRRGVST